MRDPGLLERLLFARGPGGEEGEVRAICETELVKHCDDTWIDDAGNLIGLVRGAVRSTAGEPDATLIMAHLDEIAMRTSTAWCCQRMRKRKKTITSCCQTSFPPDGMPLNWLA